MTLDARELVNSEPMNENVTKGGTSSAGYATIDNTAHKIAL